MRKSAKLSLLTVLAVLLLSTALWAQKSNWDVRPGEGVGPFHIGMTISECEKYLQRDPQADQVFVRGNMPFWIYYLNGIQINYDSQGCARKVPVCLRFQLHCSQLTHRLQAT